LLERRERAEVFWQQRFATILLANVDNDVKRNGFQSGVAFSNTSKKSLDRGGGLPPQAFHREVPELRKQDASRKVVTHIVQSGIETKAVQHREGTFL